MPRSSNTTPDQPAVDYAQMRAEADEFFGDEDRIGDVDRPEHVEDRTILLGRPAGPDTSGSSRSSGEGSRLHGVRVD